MSDALENQSKIDALAAASLVQSEVRVIGTWSILVSLVALLVPWVSPPSLTTQWLLLPFVCLGIYERYLAFRLTLDQGLCAALGSGGITSLSSLDHALAHLNLRLPSPKATPNWPQRLNGVLRLIRMHRLIAGLQTFGLLLAYLIQAFHPFTS